LIVLDSYAWIEYFLGSEAGEVFCLEYTVQLQSFNL